MKKKEKVNKVINQIFGCVQHPNNGVRYLENFFQTLGTFLTKVIKANIIAYTTKKF